MCLFLPVSLARSCSGMTVITVRSVNSAVQPAVPLVNQNVSAPQATLDPQADIPVEIVSVIGAGTLNAEWVVVSYKGEDQINLANWELRDEDRNVFVFPQLVLHTEWRRAGAYCFRDEHRD